LHLVLILVFFFLEEISHFGLEEESERDFKKEGWDAIENYRNHVGKLVLSHNSE
jgi:hypothetical protein